MKTIICFVCAALIGATCFATDAVQSLNVYRFQSAGDSTSFTQDRLVTSVHVVKPTSGKRYALCLDTSVSAVLLFDTTATSESLTHPVQFTIPKGRNCYLRSDDTSNGGIDVYLRE